MNDLTQSLRRPTIVPTELSEPYWAAAAKGELLLQRCENCAEFTFYPRYACPTCGTGDLVWTPSRGRGTLFTYTIARRSTHPRLNSRVPYVVAIVELDEGPRMTSAIVAATVEDVRIGRRVRVVFEDDGSRVFPVFELEGPDEAHRSEGMDK